MNKLWKVLIAAPVAAALVASAVAQTPGPQPKPRDPSSDVFSAYSVDALSYTPQGQTTQGQTTTQGNFYYSLFKNGAFTSEESAAMREAEQLVGRLGAAETDELKSDIKAKLSEALGKQFDLRQKRHAHEIEALESQIKKLKALVEKRRENRSEIIARRLDQIVRESQGLGF